MPVLFHPEYVGLLDGDVQSALMLSQLIYWYREGTKNKQKLTIQRWGIWWIAKSNKEWNKETGLSAMQCRRCMRVLKEKKLIEVELHRFWGAPVNHLRLLYAQGDASVDKIPTAAALSEFSVVASNNSNVAKGSNPFVAGNESNVPNQQEPFVPDSKSLTKTTAETTAESTTGTTCEVVPTIAKAGGSLLKNNQGGSIGITMEETLEDKGNAKGATYESGKKSIVSLSKDFLAMEGNSNFSTLEQIESNTDQCEPTSDFKPYLEVGGAMVELSEYAWP